MERLTTNDVKKVCYDPWELCGMDEYCKKSAHEEGGCAKGCKIVKMHLKLANYEDLEEQGLLLRLPESDWSDLIKQIQTIIANDFNVYMDERKFVVNQLFFLEHDEEFRFSATCRNFYGDEICWECHEDKECPYSEDGNGCFVTFSFSDISKTVFFTKAEAEKALAEMGV